MEGPSRGRNGRDLPTMARAWPEPSLFERHFQPDITSSILSTFGLPVVARLCHTAVPVGGMPRASGTTTHPDKERSSCQQHLFSKEGSLLTLPSRVPRRLVGASLFGLAAARPAYLKLPRGVSGKNTRDPFRSLILPPSPRQRGWCIRNDADRASGIGSITRSTGYTRYAPGARDIRDILRVAEETGWCSHVYRPEQGGLN